MLTQDTTAVNNFWNKCLLPMLCGRAYALLMSMHTCTYVYTYIYRRLAGVHTPAIIVVASRASRSEYRPRFLRNGITSYSGALILYRPIYDVIRLQFACAKVRPDAISSLMTDVNYTNGLFAHNSE